MRSSPFFAGPIADVVAREKTKISKMTVRRMKGASLLSLKVPAAWKISERSSLHLHAE